MLANELAGRIPVFFFSPGLVQTELTAGALPDDAPWTPPCGVIQTTAIWVALRDTAEMPCPAPALPSGASW